MLTKNVEPPLLLVHKKSTHTPLKPFSCQMCGKAYKREGQARRHSQGDQTETAPCSQCGEAFANDAYLRLHERSHHDHADRRRRHACPECGRCFAWRFALDCHMRSHYDGERPYRCGDCDAAFPLSWELARHRAAHDELRVDCHLCGRAFFGESELRSHMAARHSRLLRHVCGECGQRFPTDAHLCRHLLRHLGRPSPRCCQRPVKRAKQPLSRKLARHRATQDEQRVHCGLCGRAFLGESRLRSHMARRHCRPWGSVCGECGQGFVSDAALRGHLQRHLGRQPSRRSQRPVKRAQYSRKRTS